MEIRTTLDIVWNQSMFQQDKLWIDFDEVVKIVNKIKKDRNSHKCQRILQALSSSKQSKGN